MSQELCNDLLASPASAKGSFVSDVFDVNCIHNLGYVLLDARVDFNLEKIKLFLEKYFFS
jgi:hypothetical protein